MAAKEAARVAEAEARLVIGFNSSICPYPTPYPNPYLSPYPYPYPYLYL